MGTDGEGRKGGEKQYAEQSRGGSVYTAVTYPPRTMYTLCSPRLCPPVHHRRQALSRRTADSSGTSMSVCTQTNNRDMGGRGYFPPGLHTGRRTCLSPRGGPARRHLFTLSAWGDVRCLPVKRPWTALINPPIPPPTRPTHADLSGVQRSDIPKRQLAETAAARSTSESESDARASVRERARERE